MLQLASPLTYDFADSTITGISAAGSAVPTQVPQYAAASEPCRTPSAAATVETTRLTTVGIALWGMIFRIIAGVSTCTASGVTNTVFSTDTLRIPTNAHLFAKLPRSFIGKFISMPQMTLLPRRSPHQFDWRLVIASVAPRSASSRAHAVGRRIPASASAPDLPPTPQAHILPGA